MSRTIYTKDYYRNKILVAREFAAPVEKVWSAWTKSELLDQWWAPKPWKAVTTIMNFKEGGRWFYYMLGPDGSKHYSLMDYRKIEAVKWFEGVDAFTDEKENILSDMPGSNWKVSFIAISTGTKVEVEITFINKESMDKIIEMGFEEGFAMGHENLDDLLKGVQNFSYQ